MPIARAILTSPCASPWSHRLVLRLPAWQRPHFILLDRADTVHAMISQRPQQAGAVLSGYPVRVVAELGEEVQHAFGYRPAEGEMTTDFCAAVVGNKQGGGFGRIRWSGAKLVSPQPHLPTTAQFPCDQAYRLGIFAEFAAELEIDRPNLGEGEEIKQCPRTCRYTTPLSCEEGVIRLVGSPPPVLCAVNSFWQALSPPT
jgi:hypothetical protein